MPRIAYKNGVAGAPGDVQTSYRLNNTTLSAAAAAGATHDQGRDASATSSSATRSRSTRPPTASARAIPRRARSRRSARRRDRTGITLDAPLEPRPRQRALRRGLARRHQHPRHAGLQPRLVVHGEGRRADRPAAPVLGLALPADPPARRGGGPQRRRHLRRRPAPARARGPPGDVRLRQPDARRGLRADAALGDRLLAGDVPGHADAREGPVHRRHGGHLLRT